MTLEGRMTFNDGRGRFQAGAFATKFKSFAHFRDPFSHPFTPFYSYFFLGTKLKQKADEMNMSNCALD